MNARQWVPTTIAALISLMATWSAIVVTPQSGLLTALTPLPATLAYAWCGAALTQRVPDNAIGPLLLAAAFPIGSALASHRFAGALVDEQPSLAAWVSWTGWTWVVLIDLLVVAVPSVLPTGRLLSPRWRIGLWLGAGFAVVIGLLEATATETRALGDGRTVNNPVGWSPLHIPAVDAVVGPLEGLWLLTLVGVGVAALVVRYRRSDAEGRRTLRLLVTCLLLMSAPFLSYMASPALYPVVGMLVWPLLPIAIAVTVSRYHLWEMRRLFSRTFSCATVLVVLGAVYTLVIAAASALVPERYGLTGVAFATLAVVALFVPVRRRVTRLVARRFDRSHYDAVLLVERFAARMRSDLGSTDISADLLDTTRRAVRPEFAWLMVSPVREDRAVAP